MCKICYTVEKEINEARTGGVDDCISHSIQGKSVAMDLAGAEIQLYGYENRVWKKTGNYQSGQAE